MDSVFDVFTTIPMSFSHSTTFVVSLPVLI
jgi:hypothetical protein